MVLKNRFQSGIQNMRVFGIFYIDVYTFEIPALFTIESTLVFSKPLLLNSTAALFKIFSFVSADLFSLLNAFLFSILNHLYWKSVKNSILLKNESDLGHYRYLSVTLSRGSIMQIGG